MHTGGTLLRAMRVVSMLLVGMIASANATETALSCQVTLGVREGEDIATVSDDEIMLYRPSHLAWSQDGTAYVLNAGDCTVMAFDSEWRLLRVFGRKGEGPGECEEPRGLLVGSGEVCVVGRARLERFDLAGEYIGTVRLEQAFRDPVRLPGEILAINESSPRLVSRVDMMGRCSKSFGPQCERSDHRNNYLKCGFWAILGADSARCVLLDRLTGTGYVVAEGGDTEREFTLGLGQPDVSFEGYATYAQPLVASACETEHGYLVVPVPSSSEDPIHLRYYKRDFTSFHRVQIPEGVIPTALRMSPLGKLCILDGLSSMLHVCELPSFLEE